MARVVLSDLRDQIIGEAERAMKLFWHYLEEAGQYERCEKDDMVWSGKHRKEVPISTLPRRSRRTAAMLRKWASERGCVAVFALRRERLLQQRAFKRAASEIGSAPNQSPA